VASAASGVVAGTPPSHVSSPAPVLPSAAKIKKLLSSEITPHGKAAKIAAILKAGGYTYSIRALAAGTAQVSWYLVPAGAHIARGKPKPTLVATGKLKFSKAGTSKLKVKLTKAGKRLLKHAKTFKLTAKGSFTLTGKKAVTTTKTFKLRR
jgi:hypothetical protein